MLTYCRGKCERTGLNFSQLQTVLPQNVRENKHSMISKCSAVQLDKHSIVNVVYTFKCRPKVKATSSPRAPTCAGFFAFPLPHVSDSS